MLFGAAEPGDGPAAEAVGVQLVAMAGRPYAAGMAVDMMPDLMRQDGDHIPAEPFLFERKPFGVIDHMPLPLAHGGEGDAPIVEVGLMQVEDRPHADEVDDRLRGGERQRIEPAARMSF